jgi:TRAP-type C4-dicarboxylate transport system substrate-binding protein
MTRVLSVGLVVAAAALAAGCSEPLKVETIQIGRALNADQSVAQPTTTFKPNETIYVSALNAGRGQGTIRVRWYYGSQLLSDREKQVSFQGAGATEFNLQSAGNFPPGDYSVEVLVDGQSVGRRNFTVAN